jgi:hypothetical protein
MLGDLYNHGSAMEASGSNAAQQTTPDGPRILALHRAKRDVAQ